MYTDPKALHITSMDRVIKRMGEKRFALLHHSGCNRIDFHYTVGRQGEVRNKLDEDLQGDHPNSIGIEIEGEFDETDPSQQQVDALRDLLLDLKLRYPSIVVGAHRQVRGDQKTTCPGRKFPMQAIREWVQFDLDRKRDEHITKTVESQYGPSELDPMKPIG